MENKGVFLYYPLVDNEGKPRKEWRNRSVIAAIINDKDNTLSFGVSMCSGKDVFVRKHGRTKALGRARYHIPIFKIIVDPAQPVVPQFIVKCKEIENSITSALIGENKKKNKPKNELIIA